jgi:hypothetical protein
MKFTPFWRLTGVALAPFLLWWLLAQYLFRSDTGGGWIYAVLLFMGAVCWFAVFFTMAIAAASPGVTVTRVLRRIALLAISVGGVILLVVSVQHNIEPFLLFIIAIPTLTAAIALLSELLLPGSGNYKSDDLPR